MMDTRIAALETAHQNGMAVAWSREGEEVASAEEIWKFKRALQANDIANVRSGRLSGEQLNWFAGGLARQSRLVNSPF